MDEQQQHSETSRTPAPAREASAAGTSQTRSGGKRHRGRTIGLIVAALVVAGIVVWGWYPWGGPSGAASAQRESGARHGRGGASALGNQPQPVHVATATQG